MQQICRRYGSTPQATDAKPFGLTPSTVSIFKRIIKPERRRMVGDLAADLHDCCRRYEWVNPAARSRCTVLMRATPPLPLAHQLAEWKMPTVHKRVMLNVPQDTLEKLEKISKVEKRSMAMTCLMLIEAAVKRSSER